MVRYVNMTAGMLSRSLNRIQIKKKGRATATGGMNLKDRIKKRRSALLLNFIRAKMYPTGTPKIKPKRSDMGTMIRLLRRPCIRVGI
jgi:hypothetical protein